jgi:hypothetical protein
MIHTSEQLARDIFCQRQTITCKTSDLGGLAAALTVKGIDFHAIPQEEADTYLIVITGF